MENALARHAAFPHGGTARCCPLCGAGDGEPVIRRGPIAITSEPDEVFWHGRRVPLSPTETCLFRLIAVRGRATYRALDQGLAALGAAPSTRSVVMLRIRRKFIAVCGEDPFVRLSTGGVGLRLNRDMARPGATIIGLRVEPDAVARLAHV